MIDWLHRVAGYRDSGTCSGPFDRLPSLHASLYSGALFVVLGKSLILSIYQVHVVFVLC